MSETAKHLNIHPVWNQKIYVRLGKEIEPFRDYQYFRPLSKAYDGDNTFWSVPSPEPDLDDTFWEKVASSLNDDNVGEAACCLAREISRWEPDGKNLVFAAILRAGVPIADWLCRLLPGAEAVAMSLFVGLGIDQMALELLREDYPDRKIVFVDGWTGRGGVARAIRKLNAGPLAVLNDPWGWADFSGCQEDIFCPTACFTGAATLGFSRTFFSDAKSLFAAYRFPLRHCRYDLVEKWQSCCPAEISGNYPASENKRKDFFMQTDLRLHSNEVCRALINADPDTICFLNDAACVKANYPLLLGLAERRKVKVAYEISELENYKTRVACSFRKS